MEAARRVRALELGDPEQVHHAAGSAADRRERALPRLRRDFIEEPGAGAAQLAAGEAGEIRCTVRRKTKSIGEKASGDPVRRAAAANVPGGRGHTVLRRLAADAPLRAALSGVPAQPPVPVRAGGPRCPRRRRRRTG